MGVGLRLYMVLVNRVDGIRERYHKKRGMANGFGGRVRVWVYLLWLNFAYYVLRIRKLGEAEACAFYEEKKLCPSESVFSKREEPEALAGRLAAYDAVSFDVFDTLIFRPFSKPADLFYFVGKKLDYLDFYGIRKEMEGKARAERYEREGDREITFAELYELIGRECGIGKDEGMRAELEAEYRYCFANPYMVRVVEELRKRKKRIVVTSDMYLGEEYIRQLLERAGYGTFDAYYVSCDHRCSKYDGQLFERVKEREGGAGRLVHVGDNVRSDVEQAQKHGLDAVYYKNVNAAGMPFRAEDMSVMAGGLYRGIVNSHLHNGLREYGAPYEYGFVYGGWFAVGYCQFIHDHVKRQGVEKVLFLSRDGAVLSRVYGMLYPEEAQEYVYWSRLAAAKLAAGRYKYDYFRRFLYHKVNQGYRLADIFRSMELEDMLGRLCDEQGFTPETKLTDRNVERVKAFCMKYWQEALFHYEEQVQAGGKYYGKVLQGIHKVAAVDIGWAGSGAVTLSYMVNQVWGLDCQITGIVAGTNSCHNYDRDASEAQLESGRLVSYLFSQRENRDVWKFHDAGKKHNLYWEMLLGAEEGSLKGFYGIEDGEENLGENARGNGSVNGSWNKNEGYRIVFKGENENAGAVREVHRGILDFTERYLQVMGDERMVISGRDAYAPMILMEGKGNGKYRGMVEFLMDEVGV